MVYPWPHIQLYLLYLANYILYWLAPKPGSFPASYDLSRTTAHTFCCLPWHRPNVKDIVAAVFCVTTKQRYDDDTNYTKWQQLQNTFLTFIDCLPACLPSPHMNYTNWPLIIKWIIYIYFSSARSTSSPSNLLSAARVDVVKQRWWTDNEQ